MIEFMISRSGDLEIVQRDVPPTVYLDHWALRRFSENNSLATRLITALKSQNGTLALSWLNVVEFAKMTVETQARNVENLLEAILPQVFFLEVEPFSVIQREDELLAGEPPSAPHADPDFLREFAHAKPMSLSSFTARDLFRAVQDGPLRKRFENLANSIVGRVQALRYELDRNSDFRSTVGHLPSGPQIQRGTRFIFREMLRTLLVNKQMKITPNHAIDLLHAVVPVAYCNIVLLDKHWETQVERVRQRFAAARMRVPMAKVFSGRSNGIDCFLRALEKC